ncbi:tripartite tricarboxylate transporter TctB family protein [Pseudovibrio sp. Tun.PSC04-5.I4]|uniref:tripartite tricarboxylate transporter TctB family protein n=1 Tax=Pseudovibrio sp. Tun.PSC04-5.I4 TaxID=1798213 RepID=UPI000888DDAD|nr:tripartite tricarboxylate transporter TctB family protein [Pseudovibrio sp. Tun.PSC04-5.I4]SDQ74807.1 Tripartite tricarboxylate transporter TctB family protein [Pseudovibrio sp. Tun.PSC04-5.I4]
MDNEFKKSKRLDVILALSFLLPVALVYYQIATSLTEQGAAFGDAMTNAAMFPKLIATVLGFLAVIQLVISIRQPSTEPAFILNRALWNSLVVVVFLTAYLTALPLLGYHIMTPILCLSMLVLLGVSVIPAIFIGLGLSLLVALFFEVALNVVLPTGLFGLALPF